MVLQIVFVESSERRALSHRFAKAQVNSAANANPNFRFSPCLYYKMSCLFLHERDLLHASMFLIFIMGPIVNRQ